MSTEMNSAVITTEVVDLIPAPETIVTPEPKSHKPSLKTCVIAGASIGGITGGIIAADRITARRNLRNATQLAINETRPRLHERHLLQEEAHGEGHPGARHYHRSLLPDHH